MDGTDLCRVLPVPPRPAGVPPKRGWADDRCGRTVALPRPSPPPPLAAGGSSARTRGEAVVVRGRREVGDDAAERLGGNAVVVSGGLVGNVAEGVAGLVVALEERGSGGGGAGVLPRKRGLSLPVCPPPKRRAVSAKRQFPPGCGRNAPPLIVGGGNENSLQVGGAPSAGGFSVLEQAATAPPASSGGREQGGLLLESAPTSAVSDVLEKAAAADRGRYMAVGYHHGPETAVVKSPDAAEDGAIFMVKDTARAEVTGKLGISKELVPLAPIPPKRRLVSANRRFPPGCRRDSVAPLASAGGGEVGLQLEVPPANGGFGALTEVVATDGGASVAERCAMDTMEAASQDALNGAVEVEELEEGEIPMGAEYTVQEPQVNLHSIPDESTASRYECAVPATVATGPPMGNFSNEKICGNTLERKRKRVSWAVAEDVKVMNKCEARSAKVAVELSAERCAMDTMEAASQDALNGAVEVEELEEGEIPMGAEYIVQEPQVNLHSIPDESTASRECAVPAIVAAGPFMGHFSNEKIGGNTLERKRKRVSWAVAEDVEARSAKVAVELSAESPLKENSLDKRVFESCSMKRASLDIAAGVFGKGIMRSKVTFTARKTVQSPVKPNHKSVLASLNRPYSMEQESVATIKESLVPRKKLKVKGPAQSKHLPTNVASKSTMLSKEKLKDKEPSLMEDDDIFKALTVNEGKLELCGQKADARSRVKMICRRFQFICRTLVQSVEQRSLKVRRVDLMADKIIRKLPGFTKPGPVVGKVPGVEIGDEFLYRVELAIVGLHRPYQGGIDSVKDINDVPIAISIVASGGYPDELSSSGEVIYTGSGGKAAGKKEDEDQKLERGNLALKNCIKTKTSVRVIHGFKGQNREQCSHSKAKEISTFTYDGLYLVVDCWQEGLPGSRVFKYRLQRIPGQPELPLHVAKGLRKSIARPGLCIADISQGKERIPIFVINNIDNVRPTSFKYISRNKYPSLPSKRNLPQGCDCTDGCSDSATCSCAVKNGGKIPFNFNGAVVHAKPLIFDCGPSCRCPPSCHNRVSQLGMKIPLEVFRTAKTGWAVRSLRSITSGSFVCEYVGELLHGKEVNQRMNDEYLFAIGHNYDLWKGLPSVIPGLNSSSGPRSLNTKDKSFTIDAAEYGNIGRFINHSCSPNLYAQNVLWDHDDKRMPHIMFFAAENISPLQELTYDYNYEIDQVHDLTGRVKVKCCHCGSPQCRGRLY